VELQALMKFYDTDKDGSVSYEEFVHGLRDELTPRRAKMVEKVFRLMDRDGSGQITLADVVTLFDVSMNPEFIERRKTKDQILTEFLNNFDGAQGNKDGVVTWAEFMDYYTDLSMNLPSDEYFVRMLEATWQCPEDESDPFAKSTVQMLLKEVRARVLDLSKNDPKLLRKIHGDFDLN
jgi:calcyphosin